MYTPNTLYGNAWARGLAVVNLSLIYLKAFEMQIGTDDRFGRISNASIMFFTFAPR